MNRRETERIIDVVRRMEAAGEAAALATVVRVRGSAYRREGTHIVIRQDGTYECLLSGGCLEPAVAEAAATVIATGEPMLASYDLADDSVWALGVGCGGAVDIRIERVDRDPLLRAWLDVLARGDAGALVTPLAGAAGRLLVLQSGETAGSLEPINLQRDARAIAQDRWRAHLPQSGPQRIGSAELFVEVSAPPPELVIFGAGDDAMPLANQGFALGFRVVVVDARETLLTAARFPDATRVSAHFSLFADAVSLGPRSFVVIMNHHLERDERSLEFALASAAPYIGMLGPRTRYDAIRARLHTAPSPEPASPLGRVRSPIGLALGAETPEEIAISILGEIIALQRKFDGGFLSGRTGSVHAAAVEMH